MWTVFGVTRAAPRLFALASRSATKKAGGSTKNGRNSMSKRLGVKKFGRCESSVLARSVGARCARTVSRASPDAPRLASHPRRRTRALPCTARRHGLAQRVGPTGRHHCAAARHFQVPGRQRRPRPRPHHLESRARPRPVPAAHMDTEAPRQAAQARLRARHPGDATLPNTRCPWGCGDLMHASTRPAVPGDSI